MTCSDLPSRSTAPGVGISVGPGVGITAAVGTGADASGIADTAPVVAGLDGDNIRVGGRTGVVLKGNVAVENKVGSVP